MKDDATRPDQAAAMDRMYRRMRHFYDASRRYFLLGRDRLLREMRIAPGERVLEMGCGTARNLIKLHSIAPQAELYGLDASEQMLRTAARSLKAKGLQECITVKQCLAEELDHRRLFGLEEPFDVVFFSYSLSMMPTWEEAIAAALANLKPGGRLHAVDFWDQAALPRWFSVPLKRWLALFHVFHRPALLDHLHRLAESESRTLTIQPLYRRYAFLSSLQV